MKFINVVKIILITALLLMTTSSVGFPGSVTVTGQPNITASPLPTGDKSVYDWPKYDHERQEKLSWPNRNEVLENYARAKPPAVYKTFEEDEGIVVWVCIGAITVLVLGIMGVFFLGVMDEPYYVDYKLAENLYRRLNTKEHKR